MVRFVLAFATLVSVASAFVPLSPTVSSRTAPALAATTTMDATNAKTELKEPPLSPLTAWGQQIADIRALQQQVRADGLPEFAPTISAKDLGLAGDEAAQLQYFQDHAMEIKTHMQAHSAVVFRDFDLMKKQEGFQQMYEAIGMKPCLDPLHSVSARPTVDGKKNSPVYEAVNKESRKNFFIGAFLLYIMYFILCVDIYI